MNIKFKFVDKKLKVKTDRQRFTQNFEEIKGAIINVILENTIQDTTVMKFNKLDSEIENIIRKYAEVKCWHSQRYTNNFFTMCPEEKQQELITQLEAYIVMQKLVCG